MLFDIFRLILLQTLLELVLLRFRILSEVAILLLQLLDLLLHLGELQVDATTFGGETSTRVALRVDQLLEVLECRRIAMFRVFGDALR